MKMESETDRHQSLLQRAGNTQPCDTHSISDTPHRGNRVSYHEHNSSSQISGRNLGVIHALQRFTHQLLPPCIFHDLDEFFLALYTNMALQADQHRPVACLDRLTDGHAHTLKGNPLAERVSVGDNQAL